MSKDVVKFNKLLDEFLEKIVNQFDYPKLKTYRRAFLMLMETSPKTPVNLFMVSCIKYKQEIKDRNDTFFLKDETINETVKDFGNFTQDCGLDVYWLELSTTTKKSIWDYIQSLFILGEIIIKKDEKTFDKFNSIYFSEYKKEAENLNTGFSTNFLNKLNS
jgi:hypothetical protein